ncbi:MAG: hypothetical protein AB8B64_22845 [Granulosicoccus sp.]
MAKRPSEGVEEVPLVALKELGYEITQGYFFSPPVAASEFIRQSCDFLGSHTPIAHSSSVN